MPKSKKLDEIYELLREDEGADAVLLCLDELNYHPEDAELLFYTGVGYAKLQKYGAAVTFLMRAAELYDQKDLIWSNLAHASVNLGLRDESYYDVAENFALKALELNPKSSHAANVLCLKAVWDCEPEKAIFWGKKALELDPTVNDPRYNMGLAHLMRGEWRRGWNGYEKDLKQRFKKDSAYPQPRWEGSVGKKVIVYGEQGLGDEIMFASIISDMARDCELVLDCDSRLAGLYARSFDCEVHGDRFNRGAPWYETCGAEAQIPIGSLAYHYRTHEEDFPGTPYLVPDPARRTEYRALLDSLSDRPKIGIAWSGGTADNNEARRSVTLKTLKPLLGHEADFISLQYKNPPTEIPHWPHIVENHDYDCTAALVAELDLVITVTTTLVHLCGAIGKECWVLVPEKPQWRYMLERDNIPWYSSVKLFRQKDGQWPIREISEKLSQRGILKNSAPSMKRKVTVRPR
jgi:tetratricopeptide (TPR) repeat protein